MEYQAKPIQAAAEELCGFLLPGNVIGSSARVLVEPVGQMGADAAGVAWLVEATSLIPVGVIELGHHV